MHFNPSALPVLLPHWSSIVPSTIPVLMMNKSSLGTEGSCEGHPTACSIIKGGQGHEMCHRRAYVRLDDGHARKEKNGRLLDRRRGRYFIT